jgi:hypothetical protein
MLEADPSGPVAGALTGTASDPCSSGGATADASAVSGAFGRETSASDTRIVGYPRPSRVGSVIRV